MKVSASQCCVLWVFILFKLFYCAKLHFRLFISNLISDDNKLCFTFEFSKQKFSELELNKAVYSPKYSVADVTLKILIKKRVAKKSEKHVLLFFLCVRLISRN